MLSMCAWYHPLAFSILFRGGNLSSRPFQDFKRCGDQPVKLLLVLFVKRMRGLGLTCEP